MIPVLVHNPGARACSESDVTRSMRVVLRAMYGREVVENPAEMPTEQYTLWACFPRTCPTLTGRGYQDDPNCYASIAVDIDDGAGQFDFHLVTADFTEAASMPLRSLLRHWGSDWDPARGRPKAPYIHAITEEDQLLGYQPAAPRDYVVWNCEHHNVTPDEAAVAEQIVPVLMELNVRGIIATRTERAGHIDRIEHYGWFNVSAASDKLSHEDYCRILGGAFCYVVSAPSTGMLSIERALAVGVPVFAARRGRWREHYSTAEELRAYHRNTQEIALARHKRYGDQFSPPAALATCRMAAASARSLREARA